MPGHTDRHYAQELEHLRELLQRMGGIVERQIAAAVESFVRHDAARARAVIEGDRVVNELDLEIDELSLRILALHQPAALDLRIVTTALKITADLERIGDQAVNICERLIDIAHEPPLDARIDLPHAAQIARRMVQSSLDAFSRRDVALARRVMAEDDEIDRLTKRTFDELIALMAAQPTTIRRAAAIMFVSKYLERIADHATNIAEMVVFLVEGRLVRHGGATPDRWEQLQ